MKSARTWWWMVLFVVFTLPLSVKGVLAIDEKVCLLGGECFGVHDSDEKSNLFIQWSEDKAGGLTEHEFWFSIDNKNWLFSKQVSLSGIVNETKYGRTASNIRIDHWEMTDRIVPTFSEKCVPRLVIDKENSTTYEVKDCTTTTGSKIVQEPAWVSITQPTKEKAKRIESNKVIRSLPAGNRDYYRIRFTSEPNTAGSLFLADSESGEVFHPSFNTTYNYCREFNLSTMYVENNSVMLNLSSANFNLSGAKPDLTDVRALTGTCTEYGTGELGITILQKTATNAYIAVRTRNATNRISLWYNTTGTPNNITSWSAGGIGGDGNDDGVSAYTDTGGTWAESGGIYQSTTASNYDGTYQALARQHFKAGEVTLLARFSNGDDETGLWIGNNSGSTGTNPVLQAHYTQRQSNANYRLLKDSSGTALCTIGSMAAQTGIEQRLVLNGSAVGIKNMTIAQGADSGESCLSTDTTYLSDTNARYFGMRTYFTGTNYAPLDWWFAYASPEPVLAVTVNSGEIFVASIPYTPDSQKPAVKIPFVNPSSGVQGTKFVINASVTDDNRTDRVMAEISAPNGTGWNLSLYNASGDEWNNSWTSSIVDIHGNYSIRFIANDTTNNINRTTNTTFVLTDDAEPSVTFISVAPSNGVQGQQFVVSVNVTDNIPDTSRVSQVWANITKPDATYTTTRMTNGSGTTYNMTFDSAAQGTGTYNIVFIANDSSNNINISILASFVVALNDTQPPNVTGLLVTPASGTQGIAFRINATIKDNNITVTTLAEITPPNGSAWNLTLINDSSTDDQYNNTWASSITDREGTYQARIIAIDSAGNTNRSINTSFILYDVTVPLAIAGSVSPSVGKQGQAFNISINATDNIDDNSRISTVRANITYPNGSYQTVTLTNGSGTRYNGSWDSTTQKSGTYTITFLVNDSSNNLNDSITTSLFLELNDTQPPNVTTLHVLPSSGVQGTLFRLLANITDNNVTDQVWANVSVPTNSSTFTIRMTGTGTEYNASWTSSITDLQGTYSVTILANDSSNNINKTINTTFTLTDLTAPTLSGINISPSIDYPGALIKIGINASDNIPDNSRISQAWINVTLPYGVTQTFRLSNGSGIAYNATFSNSSSGGTYSVLFIVNDSSNNVATLSSNFSIYHAMLNVTAKNILDGSTVGNFSINITRDGYSSYFTTTSTYIEAPVSNQTHTIYILHPDYATNNETVTIVPVQTNLSFLLYTTNSVNFTFYDADNLSILKGINVSFELISAAESLNQTTDTGTKYIDSLTPNAYVVRYSANGYPQRFNYFSVSNRSFQVLNLYLGGAETLTNMTATVTDEVSQPVEGAIIKVLKYNSVTNAYTVQEAVITNFEGITSFRASLNTEFYKFIIEKPAGTIRKETNPTYLYSTQINFQISLGEGVASRYFTIEGTPTNVSFNNNTNNFKFTYSDSGSTVTKGCLRVYQKTINGESLYNQSCVSSGTATILIQANQINGTTWIGKGYLTFGDAEDFVGSALWTFGKPNITAKMGLLLIVFLSLLLAGIGRWSPAVAAVLVPLPWVAGSAIGLIDFPMYASLGFQIIGFIIAWVVSDR